MSTFSLYKFINYFAKQNKYILHTNIADILKAGMKT